jgi:hypothetical protein
MSDTGDNIDQEFQHRERQARPSAETVIARRVRAEQIRERAKYVKARRIVELIRIYRARYRHLLPNNNAGRTASMAIAHHIRDPERIRLWLDLWAPWMSAEECDALVQDVVRFPETWNAAALGQLLGLRDAERQRLGLRTIRACDVSGEEYQGRRRERRRRSMQRLRRARGVAPRAEYEANSDSRTKPWLAFGISRSTWQRRGKPRAVTKVCDHYPPSVDLLDADLRQGGTRANPAPWGSAADAAAQGPEGVTTASLAAASTPDDREAAPQCPRGQRPCFAVPRPAALARSGAGP